MSKQGNPGLTTIKMYRRPRKGFIPPRRVTDTEESADAPKEEPSNISRSVFPKKKRDLSPVFKKFLKVLDKQHENDSPTGPGPMEDGDVEMEDVDAMTVELEDNQVIETAGENASQGHLEEKKSQHLDDNFDINEWIGEDDDWSDVEVIPPPVVEERPAELNAKITNVPVPTSSVNNSNFSFKKPMAKPIQSHFNVGYEDNDENLARSQSQCSQSSTSGTQLPSQDSEDKKYYSAVYAKASARKHKKFEDDGYITVTNGTFVTLKSTSGKLLETNKNYVLSSEILEDGQTFKLGGREVQICDHLPTNPFATDLKPPPVDPKATKAVAKLTSHAAMRKPFVSPMGPGSVLTTEKANRNPAKPMFNPEEEGALVMPILDPSTEDVRVVVDPHISRHLREHQREGVTFLYKCVMNPDFSGAILGDEMGLGKTLQCIALLWTLLKQGPRQRKEIVKRALIVAPSSLVSNWEKEFHRWLGYERIKTFAVNSDHPLKQCPPQCPVIIISYEMATRCEDALKKMRFDIMVCDEAHKIKNRNGQAYKFLSSLACKRRILLTGTPVQNDLMELFSLVDFANPSVLGDEYDFRKTYEKPIEKYQESHSTIIEKQEGQQKALELNAILNNFFLRRTHNVMLRYLPPRVTYVVICKPTKLQVALYKRLLSLNVVQDIVTGSGNCSAPLSVILALKKLCNHPNLVHPKCNSADNVEESIYNSLGAAFPQGHRHDLLKVDDSGKMKVLASLLKSMQGQKVVVVSHYTQTLDLLENLCQMFSFQFKRLDGTTVAKQRQQIVDQFNNGINEFVFLLSSKAGGLGLNLQGASNIILYDIDWNPAHDIQAMSRCWRPGQKKLTNIYRLITSGSIEERIYHRQIAKQDLSGSVMDLLLSNSSVKFSPQDLKDIFSLHEDDSCLTHELIDCDCSMAGIRQDLNSSMEQNFDDSDIENFLGPPPPPKKKQKSLSTMSELNRWEHHGPPFENLEEEGVQSAAKDVQFVFCSRSLPSNETE